MSNVPALSSKVDPEVRRAIGALAALMDQKTTRAELTKALSSLSAGGGTTTVITGGTSGGLPTLDIPPKPANLHASGGYRTILLTWDYPAYANFAYAEVWRAQVEDLGVAEMIGSTRGTLYSDVPPESAEETTYHYWVRLVNVPVAEGVPGAAGPYSDPAQAATATDIQYLLEQLSAQIVGGTLYELIVKGLFQDTGLTELLLQLQLTLNDHVDTIREHGDSIIHTVDDIAGLSGDIGTIHQQIEDPATGILTVLDAVGQRSDDALALVATETTARIAADGQVTASLTTLVNASVAAVDARVTSESTARASADAAEATQRSLVSAQVNDPVTGLAKAHANILSESTARATADSALSSRTTALESTVNDPATGLVTKSATFTQQITTLVNGQQSLSEMITALTSTSGGNTVSVETLSAVIDGIRSLYGVAVDNNGVASGFGLISELVNGVVQSQFGVNANVFFVTFPGNDTPIIPFIISDGDVVMNNAHIKALTAANIAAGTITADLLAVAYDPALGRSTIAKVLIGDGEITNALIGNLIQSTNFEPGPDGNGWQIDKNGTIRGRGLVVEDASINTLKLAENAVTVSVGSDSTSATIDSQGQPVQVFVSCTLHATLAPTDFITANLVLKRDATVLKSYPVVKTGYMALDTFAVGYLDKTPGSGPHAYSFSLEITYRSSQYDTLVIESPYLGLTGLKR